MSTDAEPEFKPCRIARLPTHQLISAAQIAVEERPENDPHVGPDWGPLRKRSDVPLPPLRAAVETTKYWGPDGAKALTVGFLDNAPSDLQIMILQYANLWGKRSNVKFLLSSVSPVIRITRTPGEGYYSYLGTDAKSIPAGQNTMNLDSFTTATPESEFMRVVTHEFGHSLGLIHEHMRKELVALIVPAKAYRYYKLDQGWSKQEVDQQVLTPEDEADILLETAPDQDSIMCYQIPGSITTTGQPIRGGVVINDRDYDTIGLLYPQ